MTAALCSNVFKFLVKQSAETVAWSESGRLFHARGAATANARSPSDEYVRGTAIVLNSADLSPARVYATLQFDQVGWSPSVQTAMHHHAQLVVDALLDGQPVMITKQWCDAVSPWCVRDQSYGGIEDGLHALEVAGWKSYEHDIAVVQTTAYKACNEGVKSVHRHRSLGGSYRRERFVARQDIIVDASSYRHAAVYEHDPNVVFQKSLLGGSTWVRVLITLLLVDQSSPTLFRPVWDVLQLSTCFSDFRYIDHFQRYLWSK